jgi:chaperonin GroES
MVSRFNKKVVQDTVGSIHPKQDRLLVEVEIVASEFHIPKGAIIYVPPSTDHQRMVAFGKIITLGDGILNKKTGEYGPFPDEIKEGMNAVFGKFAGAEIRLDGVEHRILRLSEIIAVY